MQRVYKYNFKNIFQYKALKYKLSLSVSFAMQMNKICSVNIVIFLKRIYNIFAVVIIVFQLLAGMVKIVNDVTERSSAFKNGTEIKV